MPISNKILTSFIITLFMIPTLSFLISQRISYQKTSDSLLTMAPVTQAHSPSTNSVDSLKNVLGAETVAPPLPSPSPDQAVEVSFGPTMTLAVNFEGRPAGKNANKIFIGIAPGPANNNPQYLLSFTVTLPDSGKYQGLSLAGLSYGTTYTAYIKGPAQIVTAQEFVATAAGVNLNSGLPIVLTTGDLNEDNVIDQADYGIATAALGSTASSAKWNPNIDFNLDGVINSYDLALLTRNLSKTGDSGPWYSKITDLSSSQIGGASPSSSFITPPANVGGENEASQSGYWLWVPAVTK